MTSSYQTVQGQRREVLGQLAIQIVATVGPDRFASHFFGLACSNALLFLSYFGRLFYLLLEIRPLLVVIRELYGLLTQTMAASCSHSIHTQTVRTSTGLRTTSLVKGAGVAAAPAGAKTLDAERGGDQRTGW